MLRTHCIGTAEHRSDFSCTFLTTLVCQGHRCSRCTATWNVNGWLVQSHVLQILEDSACRYLYLYDIKTKADQNSIHAGLIFNADLNSQLKFVCGKLTMAGKGDKNVPAHRLTSKCSISLTFVSLAGKMKSCGYGFKSQLRKPQEAGEHYSTAVRGGYKTEAWHTTIPKGSLDSRCVQDTQDARRSG